MAREDDYRRSRICSRKLLSRRFQERHSLRPLPRSRGKILEDLTAAKRGERRECVALSIRSLEIIPEADFKERSGETQEGRGERAPLLI